MATVYQQFSLEGNRVKLNDFVSHGSNKQTHIGKVLFSDNKKTENGQIFARDKPKKVSSLSEFKGPSQSDVTSWSRRSQRLAVFFLNKSNRVKSAHF